MNNKIVHTVAFTLLIVGGVNWLLHAFGYNVVDMILGEGSTLTKIVYTLVGLSAIYEVVTHKGHCRQCSVGGGSGSTPTPAGDVTHG